MYAVTALGESLIDLTEAGVNELGIQLMARNPGGAPANCLAMGAKLGSRVAMIGMVGADAFGRYLVKNMEAGGIDARGMLYSEEYPTTLSIVQLDETGERSCSFYRAPAADMMLRWEDVDKSLIDGCGIFHFGGVSLTAGPCREATLKAAAYAREKGKVVSYDPNYRALLWKDPARAKAELTAAIPLCDILKVNEEELRLLADTEDPAAGAAYFRSLGPKVVLVTLGSEGAYFANGVACGRVDAYKVSVRDTTGAGDAFTGAFQYRVRGLTAAELAALDGARLTEYVRYACAAGALTTTKLGAIPALPTAGEIAALMENT